MSPENNNPVNELPVAPPEGPAYDFPAPVEEAPVSEAIVADVAPVEAAVVAPVEAPVEAAPLKEPLAEVLPFPNQLAGPAAQEMITVPPDIQDQIKKQHEAAGTQPTEARVPSREPELLPDKLVARISESAAIEAAKRGGADPNDALKARQEAIDRQEALAAAQRLTDVPARPEESQQ